MRPPLNIAGAILNLDQGSHPKGEDKYCGYFLLSKQLICNAGWYQRFVNRHFPVYGLYFIFTILPQ